MLLVGLPPDSLTVDRDRVYWTNESTAFINSVNKRTGLDHAYYDARSANNLLAFGDNLQPFPGKRPLPMISPVRSF